DRTSAFPLRWGREPGARWACHTCLWSRRAEPVGRASRRRSLTRNLDIEVRDVQGVLLDELPARLDGVAHQHREHLIGADGVFHRDLEERARVGLHSRVRELLRVHLAETLVALEGRAGLRVL